MARAPNRALFRAIEPKSIIFNSKATYIELYSYLTEANAVKMSHALNGVLCDLQNMIDELSIKLIIGFGSKITGKKKGLSKKRDVDLIIVSDYFKWVSKFKMKKSIERELRKNSDLILLTSEEYARLKQEKASIVNVALKEGKILYYDE